MTLYKGKEVEYALRDILLDGYTDIAGENGYFGKKLAYQFYKRVSSPVTNVVVIDVNMKPSGAQPSYGKGTEPKSDVIIYTADGSSYNVSVKKSHESVIQNFSNSEGLVEFLDAIKVSDDCLKLFSPLINRIGRIALADKKHAKTAYRMFEKFGGDLAQEFKIRFDSEAVDGSMYSYYITDAQQLSRDIFLELMSDKYIEDFDNIVIESLSGSIKFGDSEARADWILYDEGFVTIEEYIPLYRIHKAARGHDVARIRKVARAGAVNDKKSFEENYNKMIAVDTQLSW